MEIATRIRRLGKGIMNSYLIEADGEVTIVDAGAPSYWGDLPAELAAMGRTLEDVRAVVLTHGHSDHIGFAERIRRERGTPILVHELDAALARGEVPNPAKGLGPVKIGPLLRLPVVLDDARRAPDPADRRGLDVRGRRHARRPGLAAGDPAPGPHAGQRRPPFRRSRRPAHRRRDRDLQPSRPASRVHRSRRSPPIQPRPWPRSPGSTASKRAYVLPGHGQAVDARGGCGAGRGPGDQPPRDEPEVVAVARSLA